MVSRRDFFRAGGAIGAGVAASAVSKVALAALPEPVLQASPDTMLPLLPAKQRQTHPHDWMTSDAEIACPDPNCPSRLRITRLGKRRFSHAETTAVPLNAAEGA